MSAGERNSDFQLLVEASVMDDSTTEGRVPFSNLRAGWNAATRRQFLRVAGLGGAALLLPGALAGCSDDDNPVEPTPDSRATEVTLDLGTDVGVLNLAYALEQLEAAFYTRTVASFAGSGLSTAEQAVLTDIRNHEVIHRDFLASVLGASRIPDLEFDFTSVDFANRASILDTARSLEDAGVGAYNGAGKLLRDPANLLVAGKIVSVEARHAAAVRDLLRPGTRDFAGPGVVNPQGFDQAIAPGFVIEGLARYIRTPIRVISS